MIARNSQNITVKFQLWVFLPQIAAYDTQIAGKSPKLTPYCGWTRLRLQISYSPTNTPLSFFMCVSVCIICCYNECYYCILSISLVSFVFPSLQPYNEVCSRVHSLTDSMTNSPPFNIQYFIEQSECVYLFRAIFSI